jgi:hypothetical protein
MKSIICVVLLAVTGACSSPFDSGEARQLAAARDGVRVEQGFLDAGSTYTVSAVGPTP